MPAGLGRLLYGVLYTLFPPVCPFCRTALLDRAAGFCTSCLAGFVTLQRRVCSGCGCPVPDTGSVRDTYLCPSCLSEGPGQPCPPSVRSVGLYAGSLREAILRVKFGGQFPLARSLGLFTEDRFRRLFPAAVFDVILPVPLHPKRLRERGFNQCVLLARPLAARLGAPMRLDAVERVRHTLPQSAAAEADRRRNLKGAFVVRRPERLTGRSILLFDDVYTTGATLQELAKAVLSAGARRVCGLVLARSPLPRAFPGT